jgi:SAM-dependent methyltransferase
VSKTESKGSKATPSLPPRVRCPVCGGKGMPTEGDGEEGMCRCPACKLEFVGSPPPRRVLAEMRGKLFEGAWTADNGPAVRRDRGCAEAVMSGYFNLLEGKPAPRNGFDRNVLDVAAGLGFRLREFQNLGWNVYGLDPAATAVEFAKGCFLDVKPGWFDEPGPGSADHRQAAHFDLVLFVDAFGLLPEPLAALSSLEKILKPRGLVYVREPAESPTGRLFRYGLGSLKRLFTDHGFKAVEEAEQETGCSAWFCRKGEWKPARAREVAVAVEAVPAVKET